MYQAIKKIQFTEIMLIKKNDLTLKLYIFRGDKKNAYFQIFFITK